MPINRNIFASLNNEIIDDQQQAKLARLLRRSKTKSVLTIIGLTTLVVCILWWLIFFRNENFNTAVWTLIIGGSQ